MGKAKPTVGAIVLAGGKGARFGRNKLLEPFLGKALYRHLLDMLPLERFLRTVVVTRQPEIALDAALLGCAVAELTAADVTQADSIRAGLSVLGEQPDGAAFFVCDQPLLRAETVHKLTDGFLSQPDCLFAAAWEGKRGNPVIFPRSCFPALSRLNADQTGGAVVRQRESDLRLVSVEFPQELWDVDTVSDLKQLEQWVL